MIPLTPFKELSIQENYNAGRGLPEEPAFLKPAGPSGLPYMRAFRTPVFGSI